MLVLLGLAYGGVGLEGHASEVVQCVECDSLVTKLEILREKDKTLIQGIQMLTEAQEDLFFNEGISDAFASTYLILQGVNVSLGLATIPCSIPLNWLKGVVGGSGALAEYIQEGDAGRATLAGIVSFVGSGVMNDIRSSVAFMQQYSKDKKGLSALGTHIRHTIHMFTSARNRIQDEARRLKTDLARGGCPAADDQELLRDLLGTSIS